RRDIVNDPDAAAVGGQDKVGFTGMDNDIAYSGCREVAAFVLRPLFAAIDRNPETEFCSQKEKIRINGIFCDHVGISAPAAFLNGERRPGSAVVSGLVSIWLQVSEGVAIKRGVRRALIEQAGLNARNPGVFGQTGHLVYDVRPGFTAIAGNLKIAVVSANPDELAILWRLADRVNRGVHLGRGVVDGDAT